MCEEQSVDVLVPLVQEEFVGSPVPQFLEETVEVMKLVPQERVQQPAVERVPAPQIRKEAFEVSLAPTERKQHWIGEQNVQKMLEETVEVARRASHERVQRRTPRAVWMCQFFRFLKRV